MLIIYLIKAFEYFSLFVDGNTVSCIFYPEKQFMVLFLQCNSDAFALTGIFEGVGKQVVYNQFHIIRVAENLASLDIGIEVIGYSLALRQTVVE